VLAVLDEHAIDEPAHEHDAQALPDRTGRETRRGLGD
jgi:hypothetical protein